MRPGAWTRATRVSLIAGLGLLLALIVVAPVGPGAPAPAEAVARESAKRCAGVVFIGARASGQRLTEANRQMGPEVHAAARNAMSRLSGVLSVRLEGLPYPAVPTSRGTTAYDTSVRQGSTMLRTRVTGLLRDCPRTRVVLIGFSQGAHVVRHGMSRVSLPTAQARRVAAIGLLADPATNRRSTHRHQVRYGVSAPRRNGLVGPGRSLPPALAARTIDFCHPDDLVCSFDGPDGEIWMAKWAGRQHTAFYEQPATVGVNGRTLAAVMRLNGVR